MIFQDISRNFDMLNSKNFVRSFFIINLLENQKNDISGGFANPGGHVVVEPVLDPLTLAGSRMGVVVLDLFQADALESGRYHRSESIMFRGRFS